MTWNNGSFLSSIKILYRIVLYIVTVSLYHFQIYLLHPTPNGWETRIWLFHRSHHYHQQLIASQQLPPQQQDCNINNSKEAPTEYCQIQLIRRKVVVINKRKTVKAGASNILVNSWKKNFISLFNIDLFAAKHYLREIVRKLKILMLGKFCLHRNKNKPLHHREIPHKETFNQTIYVLFSHEDNLVR